MRYLLKIFILCSSLSITLAFAGEKENYGHISFQNSGAKRAQKAFIDGVRLLHSFAYSDAKVLFQKAQSLDSQFALAYWGEAMSANHPVWGEVDVDEGRRALEKLGATREIRIRKARTDREKDFIQSMEILYGPGEKSQRDLNYLEFMENFHKKYPKDQEIKAFYALAILGASGGNRNEKLYMRSAGLALEILSENPYHPGGMHYYIHSLDDPFHAPLALTIAHRYKKVVSSVPHAVHMASHIYGPLGLWNEAIEANQLSWNLSEERMKKLSLGLEERDYHSLAWMIHGYLEVGKYQKAMEGLKVLLGDIQKSNHPLARRYFTHILAVAYAFSPDQAQALARNKIETSDLELSRIASDLFTKGQGWIQAGKTIELSSELKQLDDRIEKVRAKVEKSAQRIVPHCSCSNHLYSTNSPQTVAQAEIINLELKALLANSKKDTKQAKLLLENAAKLSDSLPYEDGAPMPPEPAHELLANFYFEQGSYSAAVSEYRRSLDAQPGRALSLFGLASAAARAGDTKLCEKTRSGLEDQWKNADPEVQEKLTRLKCSG